MARKNLMTGATLAVTSFLIASCAAPEKTAETAPEDAWRLEGRAMVAVADPRAASAAVAVLENGGHAVDAAIAAHTVLGLVEPQSSGIGGGGFMLVYDHASGDITFYDGRETAPASIDENLFKRDDGKTMGFVEAWQSGRAVGTPSVVKLYETAHFDHGQSKWSDLFKSAEDLARDGFEVTPRLTRSLSHERLRAAIKLDDYPATSEYFYPGGEPLAVGTIRTNAPYADLMADIGKHGADVFYTGKMAKAIVSAVSTADSPGSLSLSDLSNYSAVRREGVCGGFLDYQVCSAPPPSSGAVTQIMISGLYERFTANQNLETKAKMQAFVDAQRLSYADRDHYVADADFVSVPVSELTNPKYLNVRAEDRFSPDQPVAPGDPGAVVNGRSIIDMWGRDTQTAHAGTTHMSIVDYDGNAVSFTATVEGAFGSSIWVPEGGFLLNNELTDFARNPQLNGKALANAPAPGKRPRSSMSPTIVLDKNDDLFMVTGSPGGNSIVAYTAKTVLGVIDWGLTAQDAVNLPNIVARGNTIRVETGVDGGQDIADHLSALGYNVQERQGENSGLQVVVARGTHFEGGADPRREGVAIELVRP